MLSAGNLKTFGTPARPPLFIVSAVEMRTPGSSIAFLDEFRLRKWLLESSDLALAEKGLKSHSHTAMCEVLSLEVQSQVMSAFVAVARPASL